MTRPTKTEAIANFLNARALPDLARLYNSSMEVQVNVRQGKGTRISDDYKGHHWSGYTDGITTWKPIRIPWNAKTNPHYQDSEIGFDLWEHAEGIGMTGWDWENKISRWVGYDYDAIIGHSERHARKLSEHELRELEKALYQLPYVTLRRSTGGKGLHVYVFTNNFPTANHDEHAALARAILSKMSGTLGFDFDAKVDIQGHILWVWHRKFEENREEGLKLIKQGGILNELPINWRDHIPVVSGRKLRTVPHFAMEDEDNFMELSGQTTKVPLDNMHRKLLNWLEENKLQSWWDNDHHLLVTHTSYLAEAHKELGFKGVFKTLAKGSEYGHDYNCFAFPMRQGAWAIRRFSRGTGEAETWTQDPKGWTRTVFNQEPSFDTACVVASGNLNDKDAYVFTEAELATEAVRLLGANLDMAPYARGRRTILKKNRSNKLVVEINRDEMDDIQEMRNFGYIPEGKGTKVWQKVLPINLDPPVVESEIQNFDEIIRHMVTEEKEEYGWAICSRGSWNRTPLENIRLVMAALGQTPKDTARILGNLILNPWTIVNRPFQPEYLENRQWNMKGVQFKVVPNREDNRSCPNWMKILNHIGKNLNDAVQANEWAKANGILTGADYLKCWLAAVVQHPFEQLPYLFFYSREQNSGKTVFGESLRLLFTGGVASGDATLINDQGFNAELEYAIIARVEETDLRNRSSVTYNRIKNWVTAKELSIHPKTKTPFLRPNSTHWIQTANDPRFCPIFPGDKRIVAIRVDPLTVEEEIPRHKFDKLLIKEAADFLGELVSVELPEPIDRFYIPVIETTEKLDIEETNMNGLELYINNRCHYVSGSMIQLQTFMIDLHSFLEEENMGDQIRDYTRISIPREIKKLNTKFQTGMHRSQNLMYILNMSYDPSTPPDEKLFVRDGKIYKESEIHNV